MIKFLLWNLNRKPLHESVAALANEHEIDVLILLECNIPPGKLLPQLNAHPGRVYVLTQSLCDSVVVYTRLHSGFINPIYESGRYSIRRVKLPIGMDFLLAMVHFPSKMYWSKESQSFECCEIARILRDKEEELGHSRTVFVGDLNMNPFEDGMVSSVGFNATSSRHIARRISRTVQDREYAFFYNPMWQFLGDRVEHPPGTYYYDKSGHVNYYWNVFDQVLVRPALLDIFPKEELSVLTNISGASLINDNGIPDVKNFSDHLPIKFALDL